MNKRELDKKLSQIGKTVDPRLKDRVVKSVDIFKEQRERLNELSNKRGLSLKQRDQIIRLKNQEHLHKKINEIDQDVAKRLDKQITEQVERKIKSGELPDPKKVIANDPLLRDRYLNK